MKKKGISLILLVITIIIIIIIASAVILNLNQNNPVNKARLANVQSTRDSLKSGINLYIGKIMVKENGNHNASTMILGKNTQVIDYSIIHDYSIYETIRGNLNIWQLDYSAINEKVNLKLDIYDNNSRWYIDEWGNPFLVYNSLTNVSPYLKTEDNSDILASVKDFVVVLSPLEFAENSTLGIANANKTSITNAVKRYLGANASSLNEIADTSSVKITVNGVDTNLYKLNISNLNTKAGTNLTDTYDSADWYIDENGNTYLIYDNEESIPEDMKGGVSTTSYVTVNGGTITAYVASNNSSSGESGNGNKNQGSNEQGNTQKEDGNITLSSTSGALTYGNSLDITVTNPNNVTITAESSDETIATVSVSGNIVTIMAKSSAGDVTITITGAETSSYNATTKTYSLTVWSGTGAIPVTVAKATINSSNIAEYIGTAVDYHPSGDPTGVYRIFYLDKDNKYGDGYNAIYLKRDIDKTISFPNDFGGAGTIGVENPSKYLKNDMEQFNILWKNNNEEIDTRSERWCAYLLTKSNWEKYVDNTKGAKYAIGTPSLELFIDSYNEWKDEEVLKYKYLLKDDKYYYPYEKKAIKNGYAVYPKSEKFYELTDDNIIEQGKNNIFIDSLEYYLASNVYNYDNCLYYIQCSNKRINSTSNNLCISPVVCLVNN